MLIFSIKYLEWYDRRMILFLILHIISKYRHVFFERNENRNCLGKNVYHSSVPNTLIILRVFFLYCLLI